MQPPYTPEYIAEMKVWQIGMQAQIDETNRSINERVKRGEVDPADLPQPDEGPNHYMVRRAHELTCSCATDPAKCYPHTHGKEARFREK